MIPFRELISAHVRLCWFGMACALLLACPLRPDSREEAEQAAQLTADGEPIPAAPPVETPVPPRPLEVDEQVEFTFTGDGLWHESPYLAYHGHFLEFAPTGASGSVAAEAIRFKVDQLPQMLKTGVKFRVTTPGRISFRLEPRYVTATNPELAVRIRRLE